ncbi:MAG: PaaI family thioesterase [Pseudomonadota bacterium]|nr:PaaI family thioesterase [Pseudomonadota bacterium]
MNSAQPKENGRLIDGETGAQKLVGWVTDVSHPDGRARLTLQVDDRHTNRHGVLHGGIIAMLLDSASGYTGSRHADDESLPPMLSLSFTTQFLAPAHAGEVMAIGRVTGGGRSTLFIEGELRDAEGRLIATSTGLYKRVPQEGSKS